jgi:hypothetical protein
MRTFAARQVPCPGFGTDSGGGQSEGIGPLGPQISYFIVVGVPNCGTNLGTNCTYEPIGRANPSRSPDKKNCTYD